MITIGIDPGNDTGCAMLIDGKLFSAKLGKPEIMPGADVWIELPRIRPHETINPNDLMKVAVMVGRYANEAERYGCTVHLISPNDWKDSTPKAVTKIRVTRDFPEVSELVKNVAPTKQHNVYDAVGIAQYGYAQTKARSK